MENEEVFAFGSFCIVEWKKWDSEAGDSTSIRKKRERNVLMITSPITIIIEYKSNRRRGAECRTSKAEVNALRIIFGSSGENVMQNRRDDNIKLRSLGFEFMRFYGSFRLLRGGKKKSPCWGRESWDNVTNGPKFIVKGTRPNETQKCWRGYENQFVLKNFSQGS